MSDTFSRQSWQSNEEICRQQDLNEDETKAPTIMAAVTSLRGIMGTLTPLRITPLKEESKKPQHYAAKPQRCEYL